MIKIWIDEDGDVWIRASYDAEFVDALKDAIPFKKRRWLPGEKAWVCSGGFLDDIIGIASAFFPGAKLGNAPKQPKRRDGPWQEIGKMMGPEEYKSLFRALAKKCHPDTGGSNKKMVRLTELFNELGKEKNEK